ncbi:class I SAM-dependent methyltransferase [Candidatus Peregrinibacteria bacterium]|nr:class I SAM-dependent methyltransferase [Candidatus Peregrinibacteria bacterium]
MRSDEYPIVRHILDGGSPKAHVFHLDVLLNGTSRGHALLGPTMYMDHGRAISPLGAIRCIADVNRTATFLRGVHEAIRDVLARTRRRPLQVLDAGCGPYAALTLPLLSQFDEGQIHLDCVDMHPSSCEQVVRTARAFRQECVHVICGDVMRHPEVRRRLYDVIVTETLYSALLQEPQAAITASLAPLVRPDGAWVPASVHVRAYLADRSSRENVETEHVGQIAALSPASAQELVEQGIDRTFAIPRSVQHDERERKLMLGTSIDVYGAHMLREEGALLTSAAPFGRMPVAPRPETVHIRYRPGGEVDEVKIEWGSSDDVSESSRRRISSSPP